ncbi:DUF2752 domain-containing protein [Granulicella arctica]|uniref:DUF2752 domain-containing protein n=1 Tax=Granulicella arctica TaxID=940613 RepID=UPI0021E0080E|nr:DUF2752 domain-containing protein [Granulicella arctica]
MKWTRRILAGGAPVSLLIGAFVLLRFPPAQYTFYPRCPVQTYLHLQCPGCGATRALAALLHCHFADALRLNTLFVLLLPFLIAFAALCCYRAWTSDRFRFPELPHSFTYGLLAITAIFTVIRNLAA